MQIHELKIWPQFFQTVSDGRQKAEIRRDDRGFEIGDLLILKEWMPDLKKHTNRECRVRVTDIVHADPALEGIEDGFCLLSIEAA